MLNKSAIDTQSIADFGAQRILGTPGSLMGYINTGNPYDKRYYKKDLAQDKFEKKSSKKNNGLAIGASILAAGGIAAALLKKSGKIDFKCFNKIGNKLKDLFGKINFKCFADLGNKVKNLFGKIKIKK